MKDDKYSSFCRIQLKNQSPEIILTASDFIPDFNVGEHFYYNEETETVLFDDFQSWLAYNKFLKKAFNKEFQEIGNKLEVVYGDNNVVKSTIPSILAIDSNILEVRLSDDKSDWFHIARRNRERCGNMVLDSTVYREDLSDPVEMDQLVTKHYRGISRLAYSDHFRAFFYPYHLKAFPNLEPEIQFLQDISTQRIKYQLYNKEDWDRFGGKKWDKETALEAPVRAIQWMDSPDSFGVWVKPSHVFGPCILPEGKSLLMNSKYAKISDFTYYLFGNSNLLVYCSSNPEWIMINQSYVNWDSSCSYVKCNQLCILKHPTGGAWLKPEEVEEVRSHMRNSYSIRNTAMIQLIYNWFQAIGIRGPLSRWEGEDINNLVKILYETCDYSMLSSAEGEECPEIVNRFKDLHNRIYY